MQRGSRAPHVYPCRSLSPPSRSSSRATRAAQGTPTTSGPLASPSIVSRRSAECPARSATPLKAALMLSSRAWARTPPDTIRAAARSSTFRAFSCRSELLNATPRHPQLLTPWVVLAKLPSRRSNRSCGRRHQAPPRRLVGIVPAPSPATRQPVVSPRPFLVVSPANPGHRFAGIRQDRRWHPGDPIA
jgi:hypothetical protein